MIWQVFLLFLWFWISANRRKQKNWFLWKNMHQSMSINWENPSSMLQSPPKYLFYVEHHFPFTELCRSRKKPQTKVLSSNVQEILSIIAGLYRWTALLLVGTCYILQYYRFYWSKLNWNKLFVLKENYDKTFILYAVILLWLSM